MPPTTAVSATEQRSCRGTVQCQQPRWLKHSKLQVLYCVGTSQTRGWRQAGLECLHLYDAYIRTMHRQTRQPENIMLPAIQLYLTWVGFWIADTGNQLSTALACSQLIAEMQRYNRWSVVIPGWNPVEHTSGACDRRGAVMSNAN